MTFRVEIIYPETPDVPPGMGCVEYLDSEPTLEFLQKAVGGYIKTPPAFPNFRPDVKCYCNDDGYAQKLLPNKAATLKACAIGYMLTHALVGPVCFVEEIK